MMHLLSRVTLKYEHFTRVDSYLANADTCQVKGVGMQGLEQVEGVEMQLDG